MVGALFIAEGQTVAPAHVSGALQRRRCDSSGANRGHRFRHRWRKVEAVLTANPDNPRLHCDHAVIMTNIWAPVLGDKLGVPIPLMGYEHQYLRTGPLPELNRFDPSVPEDEIVYPSVRELDTYIYFRQHWNTFGVGSYRRAAPVPATAVGNAIHPFTPADFEGEAWNGARQIFPLLGKTDFRTYPGPSTASSPFPSTGCPSWAYGSRGLWVAAGS